MVMRLVRVGEATPDGWTKAQARPALYEKRVITDNVCG